METVCTLRVGEIEIERENKKEEEEDKLIKTM